MVQDYRISGVRRTGVPGVELFLGLETPDGAGSGWLVAGERERGEEGESTA
jgi:hypothetical protein